MIGIEDMPRILHWRANRSPQMTQQLQLQLPLGQDEEDLPHPRCPKELEVIESLELNNRPVTFKADPCQT